VKQLIECIKDIGTDWTHVVVVSDGGNWLGRHNPFSVTSKEFLRYAKTDFKQNNTHGLINALTNTKRAMDCQVDHFIRAIGLDHSKAFPPEVDKFIRLHSSESGGNKNYRLIEALGVSPASIINRYRELRNKLEHFYEVPERQLVKDAIELAELLISTIDNSMRSFCLTSFTNGELAPSNKNGSIQVYYEDGSGKVRIEFFSRLSSNPDYLVNTLYFNQDDPLYLPLIKTCLLVGTEIGWDEAVKDFIVLLYKDMPKHAIHPRLDYA
jgi:hypothetical protein